MDELKQKTSATQFYSWVEYLRRDLNGFHRTDHYLARICYHLYLIMHMMGGKPKLAEKDFFIKFEAGSPDDAKGLPDEDLEKRLQGTRNAVLGALGMTVGEDGVPVATHRSKRPKVDAKGKPIVLKRGKPSPSHKGKGDRKPKG